MDKAKGLVVSERIDKPTPNGGDYSIGYFYDKDRQPCDKTDAMYIDIVEYAKDGTRINETHGYIASGLTPPD